MTKTVTSNYSGIAAPGNTFNQRITADADAFARNDVDALGNALELHDHSNGKGLPVSVIPGGLTISTGGLAISAGNIGVGANPTGDAGILIPNTYTLPSSGNQAFGLLVQVRGDSSSTTTISGITSQPGTAAVAYTSALVTCFRAGEPNKGAGSTITSAAGFYADAITTGGTNNYGAYVNAPANGSGDIGSVIAGDVMLGGSAVGSGVATSATIGFAWIESCAGTPTGVPRAVAAGGMATAHVPLCYDRTNNKLYIYNSGWKTTTVFA